MLLWTEIKMRWHNVYLCMDAGFYRPQIKGKGIGLVTQARIERVSLSHVQPLPNFTLHSLGHVLQLRQASSSVRKDKTVVD
jgi:uncharacterized protein YigE (DUF2233 family)